MLILQLGRIASSHVLEGLDFDPRSVQEIFLKDKSFTIPSSTTVYLDTATIIVLGWVAQLV